MGTTYRIHPATEDLETMLDASRRDGWTMSDEAPVAGLPVCLSLEALHAYVQTYGMTVARGDRLVAVEGRHVGPDHDAGAARVAATSYEVLGDAREWLDAIATIQAACDEWDTDEEDA